MERLKTRSAHTLAKKILLFLPSSLCLLSQGPWGWGAGSPKRPVWGPGGGKKQVRVCSERGKRGKFLSLTPVCSQSKNSKWCLGPLPLSPNVPNVPRPGPSPLGSWDRGSPLESSLLLGQPSSRTLCLLARHWNQAVAHVVQGSFGRAPSQLPICSSFGLQGPRKTEL